MPELRQNRLTKEWVIMATERAKRPEELRAVRPVAPLPHYVPTCPFCPGNEHLAPPEISRYSMPDGHWVLRVVPNKFPALAREGEPQWRIEHSRRSITGVGIHDVIVETPDHALATALLPVERFEMLLRCYRDRFHQVSADPRVAHVTIFKNHGVAAGTSLEHPHSQLIGTPIVSSQVRQRLYESLRHFDEFGECIFCHMLSEEIGEGTRLVMAGEHFLAFEPFAAASPFLTAIYPRRHMASFGDISDAELADLAGVLRTVLAKLYVSLDNPDYNYVIRTASAETAGVKYYHWNLSIIPRLTRVAGFEMGSGIFINTVLPETAAQFLRALSLQQFASAAD